MPAGAASSSEQGNGENHRLQDLIEKITEFTFELRALAVRFEAAQAPTESDIKQAYDCVGKLLQLIVSEVIPRGRELGLLVPVSDLNRALESLRRSGRAAHDAIELYAEMRKYEQRRSGARRSLKSYRSDHEEIQQQRWHAADKVRELISESEGLLGFLA